MVVRIAANTPARLALKFTRGKETRNGETEFILTTGDVVYLPAEAVEAVRALRPAPAEAFVIEKRVSESGTEWSVEREKSNGPGSEVTRGRDAQSPKYGEYPTTNLFGDPEFSTPVARDLYRQIAGAIENARAAERFARQTGAEIRFGSEDIRAFAITAYIRRGKKTA